MKTDMKQWALALIDAARNEFGILMASIPQEQRNMVGELKQWSAKDEIAHLLYWIEVFSTNIEARRKGQPLTDISNYLAMNDAAWQARKDWTWANLETELARVLTNVETQLHDLHIEDLIDPQSFTLETVRKSPRPLLRNLIYELVEHPFHHFMGLYQRFSDKAQINSLIERTLHSLKQPGTSKWSATTRNKIRRYTLHD